MDLDRQFLACQDRSVTAPQQASGLDVPSPAPRPQAMSAELTRLAKVLAVHRQELTRIYAEAFLEAPGTDKQREQAARLAARDQQRVVDDAQADLDGFRLRVDLEQPPAFSSDQALRDCEAIGYYKGGRAVCYLTRFHDGPHESADFRWASWGAQAEAKGQS